MYFFSETSRMTGYFNTFRQSSIMVELEQQQFENITIKDLFHRIATFAGVPPPRFRLPSPAVHAIGRVGDFLESIGKKGPLNSENAWTAVLYHWFDHSKARQELGFNPRPANVALKESVDWMKEQGLLS